MSTKDWNSSRMLYDVTYVNGGRWVGDVIHVLRAEKGLKNIVTSWYNRPVFSAYDAIQRLQRQRKG